ncbi:DUF6509 family protein [Sporosarcina contaminans]|uniref:DUF6509 family protein n=1 Tax=Sporosarcina contaminans TaxID=633403 RepID=A0ABW3TU34_9BACL
MEIIEYSVEELIDPTGILTGRRFEFMLYILFDEEDELYEEQGTGLRVLYAVDGDQEKIASYHFFERATDKILDFELEDEEEAFIAHFCKEHIEK